MKYQLSIVENPHKGRNKQIGSLQRLDDGRLGTFVGYCANDSCNSKVCVDFDSAKFFASRFNRQQKRPVNRLLLSLLKNLEEKSR